MLSKLRSLFSTEKAEVPVAPPARVPAGQRIYAIGDIHGRLDLFDRLLAIIDADDAARGPAETGLILLGDLIDRGPDSRGVVERAIQLSATGKVRTLQGNHEEMLLSSIDSDEVLLHFLRHGGKETLFSYGLSAEEYGSARIGDVRAAITRLVPESHIRFISTMEDRITVGDYLFVHAGIRPGVPIEEQTLADLRWIRRDFLDHPDSHGPVVVHGHTITDEPVLRPNRIGIDTGAYASGRLTALGIEGDQTWILSAHIAPEAQAAE